MALTYLDFDGRSAGNGVQAYTGLSIGTASADRWVILGIFVSRNTSTSETVTLSTGTPVAMGTEGVSGARSVRFYKALVTTGTTLDVTITSNVSGGAAFYETAVAVWVEDAGEPTLTDQDAAEWVSGSMDAVVDVAEGGAVLGYTSTGFNGGAVTWTGVTQDFRETTVANLSGASDDALTAETGRSVEAAVSGGGFENILKVISYSPPAAAGDVDVEVPVSTVTVASVAPTVATGAAASVPAAIVAVTGQQPTVETGASVSIPSVVVSVAAEAPALGLGIAIQVPAATVTVAGTAPAVQTGVSLPVPAAIVAATPQAPVVAAGAAVAVPAAIVAVTPQAPAVDLSDDITVSVPAAVVEVAPQVPVVAAGASVAVPSGTVTVLPLAPSVGTGAILTVPVAAITVIGFAPTFLATDIWQGDPAPAVNWNDVPDNSADWTNTIVGTGEWS